MPVDINGYCIEIVKNSMNQVITKFNLQNKKILSIGSGLGFEEYWFYKVQCRVTLLDKKYKNPLRQTKDTKNPTLIYILGDIYEIVKEFKEKYDLVYASGMPNDVMWNEKGLSDLVFDCIRGFLEKGLFIFQSYHGGLKMNDPRSIKKIKTQCKREDNLHLISIHYFLNHPKVSLITIFKGNEKELEEYLISIKDNPEITRFHGRSKLNPIIKEAYYHE